MIDCDLDLSRIHERVPKDPIKNLLFRRSLIQQGDSDKAIAEQLWHACRANILFYLNAFCWVYEPRQKRELPFITWAFQDDAILRLKAAIGKHDMLIEKSRDMGASWLCLSVIEHEWHFEEMSSFLLLSRKEEYVDRAEDPKALFWKIDFIHERLPIWLMPRRNRTAMHLKNEDNGSTIDGESTNSDATRGDRRTAILLDEFAAVENSANILRAVGDATDCCIFNSTPQGAAGGFYEKRERMASLYPERVIRLHWSLHPHKAAGLYKPQGADKPVEIIDHRWHERNKDYPFITQRPSSLEGVRSPWYDAYCADKDRQHVAQELEIDYLGAGAPFFEPALIERCLKDYARPPYLRGVMEYDPETCRFIRFTPTENGPFHLWVLLNLNDQPPQDRFYGQGVDIAAGTGASNSCISIGDCKTGEKVLGYYDPYTRPERLAEIAAALGWWFGGLAGAAYMIWEQPGGQNFADRLWEIGYRNFYWRRNEQSPERKATNTPGWWPSPKNKVTLMGHYRRALESGEYINRCRDSLKECLQFVYTKSQSVEHVAADGDDPSGARANHGDRVTADALCRMAMSELVMPQAKESPSEAPVGSLAWRRELRRRQEKAIASW